MPPRRTRKLDALLPPLLITLALIAPPALAAAPQPAISSFSPTSGVAGTAVRIFGSEFQGVNSVTFTGTPATFVLSSHTLITTSVPAGATTGPIRVTRPGLSATQPR